MPIFRISQTAFFLNFAHKGRTLRLDVRIGKDATPLRKIAHSDSQGDDFFGCLPFFFRRGLLSLLISTDKKKLVELNAQPVYLFICACDAYGL